jgi:uncharacterized protein YuzE
MKSDKFSFQVSVETHNRTGAVMAAYFQIRKGKPKCTKEYADGNAFADYDRHGRLVGIELLAPCSLSVLDKIAKQGTTKQFLRGAVPRGMLVTA